MSKFILVKEAPTTLRKDECVINMPNFMEQVVESGSYNKVSKLSGINTLRDVMTYVGNKYDENFSSYQLPYQKYVGVALNSDKDLSDLIVRIVNENCPQMIDRALTYSIKHRPDFTRLVYFTGPADKARIFHLEGFTPIDAKDIDSYLGVKTKKNNQNEQE